jgi:hypothetical protein
MSWTQNVECSRCWGADWVIRDGQWTCTCGKPMTVAEIAKYHEALEALAPVGLEGETP